MNIDAKDNIDEQRCKCSIHASKYLVHGKETVASKIFHEVQITIRMYHRQCLQQLEPSKDQ
jgi:hypothetical protein